MNISFGFRRLLAMKFVAAAFLLAACGTTVANSNWPGMSVKDDVVYVAYGPGVVAVDVASQEQLWFYRPRDLGAVQFFAQPSLDGQSVVIGDYGESGGLLNPKVTVRVYGLDDANLQPTGEFLVPDELWINDASAKDRIIAGPLQVGSQVFVGTAGNVMYALDKAADGVQEWQFETEKPIWSTPEYQDGVLFMGSMDGNVYALDAESGQEKWNTSLGGGVAANLELKNGLLYANSYGGSANAIDPGSGEIIWKIETSAAVWGGPAVTESEIFFVDLTGQVFAADALNGGVNWTVELGELVQTTPAYADGILYVATAGPADQEAEQLEGTLLALDASNGEIIWRERTEYQLFSGPVVTDDSVVVALTDASELLLVFDREDGSITWRFERPSLEEE